MLALWDSFLDAGGEWIYSLNPALPRAEEFVLEADSIRMKGFFSHPRHVR